MLRQRNPQRRPSGQVLAPDLKKTDSFEFRGPNPNVRGPVYDYETKRIVQQRRRAKPPYVDIGHFSGAVTSPYHSPTMDPPPPNPHHGYVDFKAALAANLTEHYPFGAT